MASPAVYAIYTRQSAESCDGLSSCEAQARELSITLLKSWLAKYEFKTSATTEIAGTAVTPELREERARQIATVLTNNELWHSHGRGISRAALGDVYQAQDWRSRSVPGSASQCPKVPPLPFGLHADGEDWNLRPLARILLRIDPHEYTHQANP